MSGSAREPLTGDAGALFVCRVRKGWFFWQGHWTDRRHKIGITNRHTYRAFTRRGIEARMQRVRRRHTRERWL